MVASTVYASRFLATFLAFSCSMVVSTCEASFFPTASGTEVTISRTLIAQFYRWNKWVIFRIAFQVTVSLGRDCDLKSREVFAFASLSLFLSAFVPHAGTFFCSLCRLFAPATWRDGFSVQILSRSFSVLMSSGIPLIIRF